MKSLSDPIETFAGESSGPILRRPRFQGWSVAAFFMALLVLAPLVVVLSSLFSGTDPNWEHLAETMLATLLWNTLSLVVGVAAGTALLGISLAWLTVACDFPGRKFFDWALMLPLAIPSYVIAFVGIGLLDFAGPVQTALCVWFGWVVFFFLWIRSAGWVFLV